MATNNSNDSDCIAPPPKLGEKFLALILHREDKEAILGDFAEAYYLMVSKHGVRQAKRGYWFEILRSLPALLFLNFNKLIRGKIMNKYSKLAIVGLALIVPAFLLVLGGVAQSGFGTTKLNEVLNLKLFVFHPIIIMGGLMLAFALNLLPVLQIRYQDGVLTTSVTIKDRLLNLGLIGAIGLLFTVIFIYLLAENLQIFQLVF